jgi:hypothetical protein
MESGQSLVTRTSRLRKRRRHEIRHETEGGWELGRRWAHARPHPNIHGVDGGEQLRASETAVTDAIGVRLEQIVLPVGPDRVGQRGLVRDGKERVDGRVNGQHGIVEIAVEIDVPLETVARRKRRRVSHNLLRRWAVM